MKQKIYIAGCGGMLGDAFYHQFRHEYELKCSDIITNEPWLEFMDMRDECEYRRSVREFMPAYLFHLGAYTDLEFCKDNPDEAYLVNTIAVEDAVSIANELNIPILYISTAGIFDGIKQLCDDWDVPNPLDVYARSKWAGERFVIENAKKYYVCRAGWMVGGGPAKDKKFVQKIMKQLKDGAKELTVVDDKGGTMTYTRDFAKNVQLLITTPCYGLYNMVCTGTTSRLDIVYEMLRILHLENTVSVKRVGSEIFADQYTSIRPAFENLINKKLTLRGINVMRNWKVCLREYIQTDYKDYLK